MGSQRSFAGSGIMFYIAKENSGMSILQRFYTDEDGFVVSSEFILIATILVTAMVVGLETVRNAALQELGDVGAAIGSISQTFTYGGVTGHASALNGSVYADGLDFCDVTTANGRGCVTVGIDIGVAGE